MDSIPPTRLRRLAPRARVLSVCILLAACTGDDGEDGLPGPDPGTVPTEVARDEDAPRILANILAVDGGSDPSGRFVPGDRISVRYSLEREDGARWSLSELAGGTVLVSGPSTNYQRVIAARNDLLALSTENPDGSYTYVFSDPLPAVYLPPLNDSPAFGADDGELAGVALLDGTYTVGMVVRWDYTVEGEAERQVGNATFDFLVGPSAVMQHREVVGMENCNRCHADLQFHGGQRRVTTLCLLCHTAGAEDRNDPSVAGGTPGASIDFRVMIHKLHNGAHLPSVLGVTTDATGARDYTARPVPYRLVGFGNRVHDYSSVEFPAWPNLTNPMPRDAGYSDLAPSERAQEDAIRGGVTACHLCHGDPDGAGPIGAPAQGELAFSQPTRKSCGSCHDDWVFEHPYAANTATMPPQPGDGACLGCHPPAGSPLAAEDAHLHPLLDPAFAAGVNIEIESVEEAGAHDADGTIDPGERMRVTFRIRDDLGGDVDPATLRAVNTGLSGPAWNYQGFQYEPIPVELLSGPQPFSGNLPKRYWLEILGVAGAGVDGFSTRVAPHRSPAAPTTVYETAGLGAGNTTLVAAVRAPANFLDVADASGFERDDPVLVGAGGATEEVLRIQWVEGDRLWFSSPATSTYPPGPALDHLAGESVQELVLSPLTEGLEYDLTPATGSIDETGGFTTGSTIVVTYTSDFVMPDAYPLALNAGPDLTEIHGGWTGKALVSGTYSLAMWGRRDLTLDLWGESNAYPELAPGTRHDFLVGDAGVLEPYDRIESAEGCYRCHVDLAFHGNNRRGWEACLSCHGGAASGDRPRYVAPNAPATDGVTVEFREMIHKIHRGAELDEDYVVVGFGLGYPDNYSANTFDEVEFPAMPDGVKDCAVCHGEVDAWTSPGGLAHPFEQAEPSRDWKLVCGSCHDSTAARGHIEDQTAAEGTESCVVCHGRGDLVSVETAHKLR